MYKLGEHNWVQWFWGFRWWRLWFTLYSIRSEMRLDTVNSIGTSKYWTQFMNEHNECIPWTSLMNTNHATYWELASLSSMVGDWIEMLPADSSSALASVMSTTTQPHSWMNTMNVCNEHYQWTSILEVTLLTASEIRTIPSLWLVPLNTIQKMLLWDTAIGVFSQSTSVYEAHVDIHIWAGRFEAGLTWTIT